MSAAVSIAEIVYNRHNLNDKWQNYYITSEANLRIRKHRRLFANSSIRAVAFNYDLLLIGQTPEPALRQKAQQLVTGIKQVKGIFNHIVIGQPVSVFRSTRDAWITTSINTQLIANNYIDPSKIKIVTENGVVYMMGHLPRKQGEIAIYIARRTQGVKKVVTIFRYLTFI